MRMNMRLLRVVIAVISAAAAAAAAAGPGSCVGRCGEVYTRGQQCTCDFSCLQHNECCQDFESTCTTARSCLGRCGETFRRGRTCDCDPHCVGYNSCCRDYQLHCDASMPVAHPSTSQPRRAASSGKRKPRRSKKGSDSDSEEWYTGAYGFFNPMPAGFLGPARPAVLTNRLQLQHGVSGPSLRGPPDSPAPGSSLPGYSTPSLGTGALYGSNQGNYGDADLCSDSPINGLTALSNGTLLIFKGELFWSVEPVTRSLGRPQSITDTLGVPAPIDTVFTRCNCHGSTYITKGDQCWRLDENLAVEPGYPKPLASEFPGLAGSIGAALAVPATRGTLETVYFFNKGDTIQRFTFSPGSVPSCSTKPRSFLKTQLARQADVVLSGEINIKVSVKGFPTPVTSALSTPSPQRSDRYHHYVFTGPLFFSVQIVEDWPAPTKPDPSAVLVPLPVLSHAEDAANMDNPPRPPNSIRAWLRCP